MTSRRFGVPALAAAGSSDSDEAAVISVTHSHRRYHSAGSALSVSLPQLPLLPPGDAGAVGPAAAFPQHRFAQLSTCGSIYRQESDADAPADVYLNAAGCAALGVSNWQDHADAATLHHHHNQQEQEQEQQRQQQQQQQQQRHHLHHDHQHSPAPPARASQPHHPRAPPPAPQQAAHLHHAQQLPKRHSPELLPSAHHRSGGPGHPGGTGAGAPPDHAIPQAKSISAPSQMHAVLLPPPNSSSSSGHVPIAAVAGGGGGGGDGSAAGSSTTSPALPPVDESLHHLAQGAHGEHGHSPQGHGGAGHEPLHLPPPPPEPPHHAQGMGHFALHLGTWVHRQFHMFTHPHHPQQQQQPQHAPLAPAHQGGDGVGSVGSSAGQASRGGGHHAHSNPGSIASSVVAPAGQQQHAPGLRLVQSDRQLDASDAAGLLDGARPGQRQQDHQPHQRPPSDAGQVVAVVQQQGPGQQQHQQPQAGGGKGEAAEAAQRPAGGSDSGMDAAVEAAWRWRFARRWHAEQARAGAAPEGGDAQGSPDKTEEALAYLKAGGGAGWNMQVRARGAESSLRLLVSWRAPAPPPHAR